MKSVYHQIEMRRLLSISMALFLGLTPLMGTLGASDDSRLPACCRRHGAHHCAMAMHMAAMMVKAQPGGTPTVTAPMSCPLFPGLLAGLSSPAPALATSMAGLPVLLVRVGSLVASGADARMRPVSINAGRGPPASKMS
jgi:hypothetical protein